MNNDLSVKMQNALQKASGKLEEIIINTYDHLEYMYDKYDILKENGNDSQIINNTFLSDIQRTGFLWRFA